MKEKKVRKDPELKQLQLFLLSMAEKELFVVINSTIQIIMRLNEPRYEKTGFLHMRKQRRRSASW